MSSPHSYDSFWDQRSDADWLQSVTRGLGESIFDQSEERLVWNVNGSLEKDVGQNEKGIKPRYLQPDATSEGFRAEDNDVEHTNNASPKYNLHGWRFRFTMLALCIAAFLSTLESTIVSASLISITDSLGGLQKSSWIVNSYLITYTSVLLIVAKLSDIFGRKMLLVLVSTIFTVFSIACGVAQTFTELVVFRAFQGVGGGAMYSLVWVILAEMAPPETYAKWSAILSSVFALSALLGPLFGGLINDTSTWRWIFLLNGPGGATVLGIILVALPWSFPLPASAKFDLCATFSRANASRVDWLGAFLLMAANVLLIAALEEGGTDYAWKSAVVLSLLFVSLAVWAAFIAWSRWLSYNHKRREPLFPWRICTNRFPMGIILLSFLNGGALITTIISLPQRFQIVNGLSPLGAAYRLLALTLCSPIAAAFAGTLMQSFKLPPFYVVVGATSLQIIGTGLITSVGTAVGSVPSAIYGYQVIMGFGLGMIASVVLMVVPLVFEEQDISVGMGAVNQARTFGGTVCLSVATSLLNSRLKQGLADVLSPDELRSLLKSATTIKTLPSDTQLEVRDTFGKGYRIQLWIVFAFCVASLLSAALLWEQPLRRYDGAQHHNQDADDGRPLHGAEQVDEPSRP